MFTAENARKNVQSHNEEIERGIRAKAQKECEEIGMVIESVSKRGHNSHCYYKVTNLPCEVEAIKDELEKNGYEVKYTSATSLKILW